MMPFTSAQVEWLNGWIAEKLPGEAGATITQISRPAGSGASAETFLLTRAGADGDSAPMLVLRREIDDFALFPAAPLAVQAQVLGTLAQSSAVPVAPLVGAEEGDNPLGGRFMVTRAVEGRSVPQKPPYNAQGWIRDLAPPARRRVWLNAVEAMAAVHQAPVPPALASHADSGNDALMAYLGWVQDWFDWAAREREQPVADAGMAWLKRHAPRGLPAGLLWGDATPANLLVRDDASIAAVLDWEMVARGPGEVDLGWWLFFDQLYSEGMELERLEGLPTREETIEAYEVAMGRKTADMAYFEVLAMVRLAIVAVRQCDRQIARGTIPSTSRAYLDNPMTAMIARQLGLPVPHVGADFHALHAASTAAQ